MFATLKTLLAASLILGTPLAIAQGDAGSDKVDLKKLEEKYWAAKDSDYSVVQNRAYPKAQRFFASLSYGPLVNDAYSIGRMTNLAVGYFASERYGFEFSFEQGNLSDNDGVSKYREQYGVQADYNKFVSSKDLSFIFVPLYAKMSFMDRAILYFDMQFAVGIGQTTYSMQRDIGAEQKDATNFHLDVSQQLFFHEHIALRLDIKNKWTKQDRQRYQLTGGQTDRNLPAINTQDTTLLLGVTYFY